MKKKHKEAFEFWQKWEQKEEIELFESAGDLAQEQREVKAMTQKTFSNEAYRWDRSLTHVGRYRKAGKWLSGFHTRLYNKRVNNLQECPLTEYLVDQYAKEKQSEHIKKIHQESKASTVFKKPYNLMDLNEACKIFAHKYLVPAFANRGVPYEFDDHNKPILRALVSYFTRQEDCPIDLNKGICLYGAVGCGKTTIMRQLSKFTKDYNLITMFNFVPMDDVYSNSDQKGLGAFAPYKFVSCCFDDIGQRDSEVNNYGTKIDCFKELLKQQYLRFSRPSPSLSHYTTNMNYDNNLSQEMQQRFGTRELDRFNEMCTFIHMDGGSRRKY